MFWLKIEMVNKSCVSVELVQYVLLLSSVKPGHLQFLAQELQMKFSRKLTASWVMSLLSVQCPRKK